MDNHLIKKPDFAEAHPDASEEFEFCVLVELNRCGSGSSPLKKSGRC